MNNLTEKKEIRWKIIRQLILAALFTVSMPLAAQYSPEKIDSLKTLLISPSLTDKERFLIYKNLSDTEMHADTETLLKYAREGIIFAAEKNNPYWASELYNNLGVIYYDAYQLDSALVNYKQALAFFVQSQEKDIYPPITLDSLQIEICRNTGSIYQYLGNYDLALDHYLLALDMAEKMNRPEATSDIYLFLGNTFMRTMQIINAETYYKKAEQAYLLINDSIGLADVFHGLSNVYIEKEDFVKALEYADESYRILSAYQEVSIYKLLNVTQLLVDVWLKIPDFDKAMEYAMLTVDYAWQTGISLDMTSALYMLSTCYLYQGKYADAEITAFRALETDSTDVYLNAILYATIAQANIWLGNSAKGIEYFSKTMDANRAFSNKNFQSSLSEMEVKYETQKKELEIAKQNAIINRQTNLRYALLAGIFVMAVFLSLLFYMLRLRSRRNRALAERNDILVETNATKDKFLSIISHDLKNPAIAQRDALQLLIHYASDWDAEFLSQYYTELLKSADNQVELLYNLLNWAQVQTRRMPYVPVQFDLVAALRSDIALIRNMAERKGVAFDMQSPETAVVTGDSYMITTVVRNLLTNAVKFTAAGGTVSLRITAENDGFTTSVSDTGTGMSEEQLQDLFRIDRPHSRSGTAGEQGSGLGLIVCKEMIERHNAILHVESEPGQGSRFWFVL